VPGLLTLPVLVRSGPRYARNSTGGANRPPKTKLKINHEHILLTVQRGHVLRSRARLLVLRSPARTACFRPGDDRVSLSRLPDDEAGATPDSCQHHQQLRERPGVVVEPKQGSIVPPGTSLHIAINIKTYLAVIVAVGSTCLSSARVGHHNGVR
jgi:hypothetical protein